MNLLQTFARGVRFLLPVAVALTARGPVRLLVYRDDPAAELQAILRDLEQAQRPWYERFHAVRDRAERERMLDQVPGRDFVDALRELAEETKGTDVALAAWTRLYGLGKELRDEAVADAALARITSDHIASPELESLCTFVSSWARPGKTNGSVAALRSILAHSPHRRVQAAATRVLAVILAQSDADPAAKTEARALFERLRKDYADLGECAEAAEAGLFELDHLQIGMTAPDFEAVDQTGARFKLSDARDRVVLIDFWGSW